MVSIEPQLTRQPLPSLSSALVPVLHGLDVHAAISVAGSLAAEVQLLGLVSISPDQEVSAGAQKAQLMRTRLRDVASAGDPSIRVHPVVRVSRAPWGELLDALDREHPDLLVVDWRYLRALGVTLAGVLERPRCDVVLVGGAFPEPPRKVLVPVRAGPDSELALRLCMGLQPSSMTTLHLSTTGYDAVPRFRRRGSRAQGLEQVLGRLPDVRAMAAVTDDFAQTIVSEIDGHDLVVVGATVQPLRGTDAPGALVERLFESAPVPVLAVKNRAPMVVTAPVEEGPGPVSTLVDKWFAENTFEAAEFDDIEALVALKRSRGLTVSLALPALNEEKTIGNVITTVKRELMDRVPLLDEIVLIDSSSTDRTRAIAEELGIPVHVHQEILPEWGARVGKGEALWKSLFVTSGDIVAWIDTDIVNIHPRFVYATVGPLLRDPRLKLVKGFYRRPLNVGGGLLAQGGGRVTELTARPMLNLFYPELSGLVQPLAGEYAGRRDALEQLPFFSGYGVETGLLIDFAERYRLSDIAQVNLGERVHNNQSLEALSRMSFAIIQALVSRIERRTGTAMLNDLSKSMKLIRYEEGTYSLDVREIIEHERPPMIHLPEYLVRRAR